VSSCDFAEESTECVEFCGFIWSVWLEGFGDFSDVVVGDLAAEEGSDSLREAVDFVDDGEGWGDGAPLFDEESVCEEPCDGGQQDLAAMDGDVCIPFGLVVVAGGGRWVLDVAGVHVDAVGAVEHVAGGVGGGGAGFAVFFCEKVALVVAASACDDDVVWEFCGDLVELYFCGGGDDDWALAGLHDGACGGDVDGGFASSCGHFEDDAGAFCGDDLVECVELEGARGWVREVCEEGLEGEVLHVVLLF